MLLINVGCVVNEGKSSRLYEVSDMEDLLRDYYTNDLGRISPGIACGNFKAGNDVGCFKLVVNKERKAVSLLYENLSDGKIENVYQLDSPSDFVFIEKVENKKLENSTAFTRHKEVELEEGQPSLQLIFFEKSAVIFYWKDGRFHQIWVSD